MCLWQKLKLFEKLIKSGYLFKIPFASRSLWPRKFLGKFENIANLWAKMSQLPPWCDAFKWAKLGHFLSDFDVIFACSFFRDESNGDNN